ncbi:MAG: pyridoxamine 5'-phosphate oxidase [Deltaproteobacteria bacterium]|nr:pyridoxamine 5'-phosphate oxidase [Deltaproteobacteria bacterium]
MQADGPNPFPKLLTWWRDAQECGLEEPAAMCVSSVDDDGFPRSRTVLLRGLDERGFVFFTNFKSRKACDFLSTRVGALTLHWWPLSRQVNARGAVHEVSEAEADQYFSSRARQSQLSAWASHQSEPLSSRQELLDRLALYEKKFGGVEVPRPPHWSGFRLVPTEIELWNAGDHRLHHRQLYTRLDENGWGVQVLNP